MLPAGLHSLFLAPPTLPFAASKSLLPQRTPLSPAPPPTLRLGRTSHLAVACLLTRGSHPSLRQAEMDKRDAERRARMAEETQQREIANAAKRKQAEERIASE